MLDNRTSVTFSSYVRWSHSLVISLALHWTPPLCLILYRCGWSPLELGINFCSCPPLCAVVFHQPFNCVLPFSMSLVLCVALKRTSQPSFQIYLRSALPCWFYCLYLERCHDYNISFKVQILSYLENTKLRSQKDECFFVAAFWVQKCRLWAIEWMKELIYLYAQKFP